jgi:hypothetical protein
MMKQLQIGDQIVLYDRAGTEGAYAGLDAGDAERCGCSYCRNFAAQRSIAYPAGFRGILNQLGIDADKEGEVYEYGSEGSLWQYGGWFYFSGQFIQPGERMTDAGSGFQFYFADAKRLPKPAGDFGENVLAVEFSGAKIPWVIADRP